MSPIQVVRRSKYSRVIRRLCAILALLCTAGCHFDESQQTSTEDLNEPSQGVVQIEPAEQQRLGIVLTPVRNGKVLATVTAVGWLDSPPAAQTIVRAPISGFVTNHADLQWPTLGQELTSGTALGQLNVFLSPQEVSQMVQAKEDNDIQMQQALVTMDLSEAQLRLATAARDAITGVRIDQLKEAYERSKAAYKEAQDKIPFLIQEPYENGLLVKPIRIDVPITGRVLVTHCAPGNFVLSGDPLWTVADWSTLWLRVPIFEADANRIDLSKPAHASVSGKPDVYSVTPLAVPTAMKPGSRTIDLYYQVTNLDWRLRVGQSLTIELPTNKDQLTVLIPRSSVLYDGFGQTTCFVAETGDGHRFRRQRIELGSRHSDEVAVVRGLGANDIVVSIGAEQIAAEDSKADLTIEDED